MLTSFSFFPMLDKHSQKTSVGRGNPQLAIKTPTLQYGVFLCASFSTVLNRVASVMAGFYGQRLALAAPVGGFPPHLSPSPDTVESISGGYSESTGDTVMVNHATNPPKMLGIQTQRKISLNELLADQKRQRGLDPIPLEAGLLISRIKAGGHSGHFLADAFISAYRTDQSFNHSLGELVHLDSEAFRLFHEILHIRHVNGWNDAEYYQIEQRIKEVMQ